MKLSGVGIESEIEISKLIWNLDSRKIRLKKVV